MDTQFIVRRNLRNELEATSTFDLGDNRRLRLSTHKTSAGRLVTTATVHTWNDGFATHRMFADFSERVEVSEARCTEKNIRAQHQRAVDKLDEMLNAARAHYANATEHA